MLDWPASGPVEATVEIDGWRDLLLLGLEEELRAQTAHRDDSESDKKVEAYMVAEALNTLREVGVLHLSGDLVWASRCARRLSDLGMVSI